MIPDMDPKTETLFEVFSNQHSFCLNTFANRGCRRIRLLGYHVAMAEVGQTWLIVRLIHKLPWIGTRWAPDLHDLETYGVSEAIDDMLTYRPKIQWLTFGSTDGIFYALNIEDGSLEWSTAPDYSVEGKFNYITKPIISSPLINDGKAYFGSTNGKIYCFDAQTFEEKPVERDITVPVDTWIFLIASTICVVLITLFYLIVSRRKNS